MASTNEQTTDRNRCLDDGADSPHNKPKSREASESRRSDSLTFTATTSFFLVVLVYIDSTSSGKMPILDRCWNPLMMYHFTNVRFGSYYVAVYTAVIHIVFIFYAIYAMQGGRTEWFFSPYFEYSQKGTVTAASLTIVLCCIFLVFTYMLCKGVRRDNRCMYFPWMMAMTIEILLMVGVGLWYIVRYYRNLFSVLAAILLWTIDGFHIYSLLVVVSQYQIVKNLQEPKFEFLYP